MWYNLIFVLVIFIAAFIGFSGYTLAKSNNIKNLPQNYNKVELGHKLSQLPGLPVAEDRPVGAMCYRTSAPPERAEYICPVCGEMTLYPSNSISGHEAEKVVYYRTLVQKITKIDVKLDESQLCEKCCPKAENRELCLIVKLDENAEAHKTCGITGIDINRLYEYSEGKNIDRVYLHTPLTGSEKKRLEELIGAPLKNNEK